MFEAETVGPQATAQLRREYEARLRNEIDHSEGSIAALQRRAVLAQRQTLTDLRARHVIGDDAFHVVEEKIDLLELTAEARVHATNEPAKG